jgi:uncharacterized protein YacL (UPF0231 family)
MSNTNVNTRDKNELELKKDKNTKLLTSIYQNVQTALQSIDNIMPSIKSDALASELSRQESEYNIILKECEIMARSEGIDIKDNNLFEKIRLWSSIKFSTLTDKSTSHIAEMLLLGTFMGTLVCAKDDSDHVGADEEIRNLLRKLQTIEEMNIERLKTFL